MIFLALHWIGACAFQRLDNKGVPENTEFSALKMRRYWTFRRKGLLAEEALVISESLTKNCYA